MILLVLGVGPQASRCWAVVGPLYMEAYSARVERNNPFLSQKKKEKSCCDRIMGVHGGLWMLGIAGVGPIRWLLRLRVLMEL